MALIDKLKEAFAEAGVTPEHFAKLEEVFTDAELQEKLAGGYMKNKAFTEKTQALALERKKLEDERKEFTEGRDYLDGQVNVWKQDMEKRLNDALAQVAASSLRGAALETKLRTLAAQYGEDPAELLADVKETREEKKAAPAFDDAEFSKKYVPRDEFTTAANQVYAFAPMIRDFERDYQKTFGKEYEGSITELINESSRAVQEQRSRGRKDIDLFGYMREKLDFKGQVAKNQEAATAAAAEERKTWETKTRDEIERDVRSKVLAENPAAYRSPDFNKPEAWRGNLGAAARQNKVPDQSPQAQFQHQQKLHSTFNELAAKAEAKSAA